MVEKERKEVKVSVLFNHDLQNIYAYGEELFGPIAAKTFIADIYSRIWSLDESYLIHPECRHLATKGKIYRNIIIGSYLVIYRITNDSVDVLRILHSHSSISKIRTARPVKLP